MSIAPHVQNYLSQHHLAWEPVPHPASGSCIEAAHLAHVPEDRVAKAVVLEDDDGYVLAVIGANRHLDVAGVREALRRDLTIASERELRDLFRDCAPGAVPPVGEAYGIPTIWDGTLADKPEVYFEGGDHETLVHLSGANFAQLMRSAQRCDAAASNVGNPPGTPHRH